MWQLLAAIGTGANVMQSSVVTSHIVNVNVRRLVEMLNL